MFKARAAGIASDSSAPFWRGETAEKLIDTRVAARQAEREAKRLERAAQRAANRPASSTRASRSRERSPNAQLRRLERALERRKTLAARQRVAAQIEALRQQLGA